MNTILRHNRNINVFIAVGMTTAVIVIGALALVTSTTVTNSVAPNVPHND